MKRILYLFLIIFFALSFGGCGKEKAPAKNLIVEKTSPSEAKKSKEPEEVKKAEQQEEYKYDVRGRRDPFLSLVEITKQKTIRKKGASPVESYDIDEIKLLAIAWNSSKHYALIMLPDKKTYTITEGMTLGLQAGKVQKITKDSVVIREYIKDYRGENKPRDSILKLHKGEEE
jgi:Tfp pilus assembly protein PilP